METKIKNLYRNQKPAIFYVKDIIERSKQFVVGQVIAYDIEAIVEYVLIRCFDSHGFYNGMLLLHVWDITGIKTNGKELKHLRKYIGMHNKKEEKVRLHGKTENLLNEVLFYLKEKKEMIAVHTMCDWLWLNGIIQEIGRYVLKMKQVDIEGVKDDDVFLCGGISAIKFDTQDFQNSKLLQSIQNVGWKKQKPINFKDDLLRELKENGQLAEFYWKKKCVIGRVLDFEETGTLHEEAIILERYDKNEQYDGILLDHISGIEMVVTKSKRIKSIEKRIKSMARPERLFYLNRQSEELRTDMLLHIKNQKEVVLLYEEDETPAIGFIRKIICRDEVLMELLDKDDMNDGLIYTYANGSIIIDSKICKKEKVSWREKREQAVVDCNIDMFDDGTFDDFINELQENRKLVSLCLVSEEKDAYGNEIEEYKIGQIIGFDQDYIVIKVYDQSGVYDGIHTVSMEKLINISMDTTYLSKMEKLIGSAIEKESNIMITGEKEYILNDILFRLKEEKEIVSLSVEDYNPFVYGFILKIRENEDDIIIKIEQFDINGTKKGYLYVAISDIYSVQYDTKSCNKLKWMLHEQRIKPANKKSRLN